MPAFCSSIVSTRRQIERLELEPHLNTCFRHFMLFTLVRTRISTARCKHSRCTCIRRFLQQFTVHITVQTPTHRVPPCLSILPSTSQEFNLIDERELAPLKELIDRMVR